jgi:hypothetical protein
MIITFIVTKITAVDHGRHGTILNPRAAAQFWSKLKLAAAPASINEWASIRHEDRFPHFKLSRI